MNNSSTSAPNNTDASSFNNAATQIQKMSGSECISRFHQQLSATNNRALRTFNKMSSDFKFTVLTLANRSNPGTFQERDIGEPFESFDEEKSLLIIRSMNEISRWGSLIPRYISEFDKKVTG
ncbi:hypothetical protein [Phytobacter sp. V91]|uniref:hypothetical protein n=1 Tax=Phytobacter sp. V91 TaxID=3369425 RepID=UPI003F5E04C7